MKKVLFTVLAGVLAGMTFVPALAQDDAEKKFEFNGEVRARYENLNNYTDLKDGLVQGDANDDASAFTGYRVLVGLTGMFEKNVTAHVDLQYYGFLGDATNVANADGTPIAPFLSPTAGLALYQGWVEMGKIGGSEFGARLGRQENTYGTELLLGDNDYYNGRAFDGVRGMWQHGSNDLNFFYYKILEGNNPYVTGLVNGVQDTSLFGATYDWNFKTMGTVGGYWIVAQQLQPTGGTKFDTYGARWNRGMMTGDKLNMFDWNIEYAMQSGDENPTTTIGGWIGEGWFAYNFKVGDSHGRVHIGTLMTSGDKTTGTDAGNKDEDFFNLFGDFHANNRFGDMDWIDSSALSANFDHNGPHNITDYNIGYEHWIGSEHYVMFAYHMFSLTEANGAPNDKIGNEIDLKYGYQYSKNLSFEVMLGQMSPDSKTFVDQVAVPDPGPNDFPKVDTAHDAVTRAAIQAKVRW